MRHPNILRMNISKKILKKAIDKWGRDMQIKKIEEEALELGLAISRLNNPTKDKKALEDNLYDELGDMMIMMEQAKLLFDEERINERVRFKMDKMNEKYFKGKQICLKAFHDNCKVLNQYKFCPDCGEKLNT